MAKTKEELRIYNRDRQRIYKAANRSLINARAREYQRKRRETPEGKLANAQSCRKRQTGFTPELWDQRFVEQDGLCAICRCEAATDADHNHTTRQPRGILCHGCNTALGGFRERPERLTAAIAYVRKWNNG